MVVIFAVLSGEKRQRTMTCLPFCSVFLFNNGRSPSWCERSSPSATGLTTKTARAHD